jgi:hypothetical protein
VRQAQIASKFTLSNGGRGFWLFMKKIQYIPWLWQTLIFGLAFAWMHVVYDPFLFIYRLNNKHVVY